MLVFRTLIIFTLLTQFNFLTQCMRMGESDLVRQSVFQKARFGVVTTLPLDGSYMSHVSSDVYLVKKKGFQLGEIRSAFDAIQREATCLKYTAGSLSLVYCGAIAYTASSARSVRFWLAIAAATILFRQMNPQDPVRSDFFSDRLLLPIDEYESAAEKALKAFMKKHDFDLCYKLDAFRSPAAQRAIKTPQDLSARVYLHILSPDRFTGEFPWLGHYSQSHEIIENNSFQESRLYHLWLLLEKLHWWMLNPLSLTFLVGIARLSK